MSKLVDLLASERVEVTCCGDCPFYHYHGGISKCRLDHECRESSPDDAPPTWCPVRVRPRLVVVR